jgi:hypothetical protein
MINSTGIGTMKATSFCFVLICSMFWTSCNKENENATPVCVQESLVSFDTNESCDGATVKRYNFQGNDVFLFDPGQCPEADSIRVMDADCNILGYLGGILGNSHINGVEFYSNSEFEAMVWAN